MVIEHLVAANLADSKIFRLGMRKIKPADRTRRPHRVAFRQLDGRIPFHVEQLPQNPFLRVVGAGGITGRRADSPIPLADQILACKVFGFAVAPVRARALVQTFGESLRQPVGERLAHDGIVIIMILFKALRQFIRAVAGRDGECAQIIRQPG